VLAREKHPGQRNSLDALCKRYDIDNSNRQLHGALLDAEILAFVYLAMTGGQTSLFADSDSSSKQSTQGAQEISALNLNAPVILGANSDESESHLAYIEFLKQKSGIDHWGDSN